jgi:hypothetical protein
LCHTVCFPASSRVFRRAVQPPGKLLALLPKVKSLFYFYISGTEKLLEFILSAQPSKFRSARPVAGAARPGRGKKERAENVEIFQFIRSHQKRTRSSIARAVGLAAVPASPLGARLQTNARRSLAAIVAIWRLSMRQSNCYACSASRKRLVWISRPSNGSLPLGAVDSGNTRVFMGALQRGGWRLPSSS